MAHATDDQSKDPLDAPVAAGVGRSPGARFAWSRRRVALAIVSLVVAGGLSAAVLVSAGAQAVHYKMGARFAYPGFQVGAMAITPDSRILYVIGCNSAAGNSPPYYGPFPPPVVVPISVDTGAAGKPIPLGHQPVALAISPNGKTLFVATNNNVVPIDTSTTRHGKAIPVRRTEALAITPDGRTLYVLDLSGAVVPVNTATGTIGNPIAIGGEASALTVAPDGKTLYVAGTSASGLRGWVIPISTATGLAAKPAVIADPSISVLAVTPDGKTVYAAGDDGIVTPVSTATDREETPITTGNGVTGLALSPDGATLYVAGVASDSSGIVLPISTTTGAPGAPVLVGLEALALAIAPHGNALYAAALMGSSTRGLSAVSRVVLARS